MAQRQISVFRLEYEKLPKMQSFTAFIAAFTMEEATVRLKLLMGDAVYISSAGLVCPLHDISQNVRNILAGVDASKKKEKVKQPTLQVEEVPQQMPVNNDDQFKLKSGRGRKPLERV